MKRGRKGYFVFFAENRPMHDPSKGALPLVRCASALLPTCIRRSWPDAVQNKLVTEREPVGGFAKFWGFEK
jgi:hypothetical protein